MHEEQPIPDFPKFDRKDNPDYLEDDWIEKITTDKIVVVPKTPEPEKETELDRRIADLEKELETLKSQKNLTKFTKIAIQRNQSLLKHLFENVIKEDGFICGGFGRVSVSKNSEVIPSADIDIYCKDKDSFDRISNRLELNGYFEKSETARTMQHSFSGALPVQLIMPLNEGRVLLSSNNVEDILNNFDFSIARVAITSQSLSENMAIVDVDFEKDDEKKLLNIKNIHCPIAQVYRVSKYMEKGFWLPMKQTLKIFEDWDNRDSDYKSKIFETVKKEDPTKEEIQDLEKLLHID